MDIHHRIYSHKKNKILFDEIYYIPVLGIEIASIERELIKHFRPPINKADNPDKPEKIARIKIRRSKPIKIKKVGAVRVHSPRTPKRNPNRTTIHSLLVNTALDKLMPVLNTLSDIEKEIIIKRHGLFDNEIQTLQSIAGECNISRERVRQIQAKAERRLNHPSKINRIKEEKHGNQN